jgi:arylsulfatase A-like enzyme
MQPGQQTRQDVYVPTSAVDVLPTLAAVTGQPYPQWTEGKVLPPFSDEIEKTERSIFALEASDSPDDKPLNPASVMMIKGKYKLTYYFGYEQLGSHGPLFELYDLENDPQELNDLYSEDSDVALALRTELLAKIDEVNKPYQTK